jgi:hypothetical protein
MTVYGVAPGTLSGESKIGRRPTLSAPTTSHLSRAQLLARRLHAVVGLLFQNFPSAIYLKGKLPFNAADTL